MDGLSSRAVRQTRGNGSRLLLDSLVAEGTRIVFGYPGGAVLHVYDELAAGGPRHVLVRHEQGAAHAADGYARATGEVGVCLATSGPGATNLVTGLATAYMDSSPVVAISGQVGLGSLGRDAFQEADITGITLPIVKHSYLVRDAQSIPQIVREAFIIASTGRPGPVLIVLPKDVSGESAAADIPGRAHLPGYRPVKDGHPLQVSRLATALARARRPVLYVGGGAVISGAEAEIRRLVGRIRIPVVSTLMGLGTVPFDHPDYLGMVGMHGTVAANYAVQHCDLLLAVGVRFDDRVASRPDAFAPQATVAHIDVDSAEIGKNVPAHIPIVGDARRVVAALQKHQFPVVPDKWREHLDLIAAEHQIQYRARPGTIHPSEVITTAASLMDPSAVVVTDVGQHQMFCAQLFPVSRPRQHITSGGLGTMGFGLPAAIGARLGTPNRRVVLISGEGGFQMNSQELATAVEQELDLLCIIVNNGCLGMVRQWQELFYDRRYSEVEFTRNPNFAALARAYGATGMEIDDPAKLQSGLADAMAAPGVVVVDVRVDPEANVYPITPPGGGFDDIITG